MQLSIPDLVLLAIIVIAFLLGFYQGAIRQVLTLLVWIAAFVLSANLRDPLGDFLSRYWSNLPSGYAHMISFGVLFILFFVIGLLLIQWRYRRTVLHSRVTVIDELIGGLLGALVAVLVIASFMIVLGSFYSRGGVSGQGDVALLGQIHRALADSTVGSTIRTQLLPPLLTVLGPLLPSEVTDVVRR
jgi:membrane protein required for colicin V production